MPEGQYDVFHIIYSVFSWMCVLLDLKEAKVTGLRTVHYRLKQMLPKCWKTISAITSLLSLVSQDLFNVKNRNVYYS